MRPKSKCFGGKKAFFFFGFLDAYLVISFISNATAKSNERAYLLQCDFVKIIR